jgi:hypothetical protein
MTDNEILEFSTQWIDFLVRRQDKTEAMELDYRMWWLLFERNKKMRKDTILNYLNIRSNLYLHWLDLSKVEESLKAFQLYSIGLNRRNPHICIHIRLKAEFFLRRGEQGKALRLLKGLYNDLKGSDDKTFKADVLTQIGAIETNAQFSDYPYTGYQFINRLSEALAEAEASKDDRAISDTYCELGRMFARTYPALGLSLQWKAIAKAYSSGDRFQLFRSLFYKAKLDIGVHMKYCQILRDSNRFERDAMETMKQIKRDELNDENLQVFYDETYGIVMGDAEALERALAYYIEKQAYGKVYETAKNMIGFYMEQQNTAKSKEKMVRCLWAAQKLGDQAKIKEICNLKKQIG